MNSFRFVIFLGLAFLLNGCSSDSMDEELADLEIRYKSVISYREMRSICGGATEYFFLLEDGKLVARRTKSPDGSISLDKYREAQGYIIRGRKVSRSPSLRFSLDLTFVPMGFSGFPRFRRNSLVFCGYETIGEVECARFESKGDTQQAKFWMGLDDGIVRKHTYVNETLTMPSVVIESIITEVNSVNESKFELPSGAIIKKGSAQESALSGMIADFTRKQRVEK